MTYSVKEIYYTLQGEGAQVGRAAERSLLVTAVLEQRALDLRVEVGGRDGAPDPPEGLADAVREALHDGRSGEQAWRLQVIIGRVDSRLERLVPTRERRGRGHGDLERLELVEGQAQLARH